ncbi:uncharacterized protein [Bos taurus]|uniref:uncharacterized protein isoform X2 n=1 Tax=Bos taurus TaxID=9913 RepID=UPI0007607624|nr:uncharacterized protein LOC107131525 isoform X2 [Bos taurus]
MPVLNKVCLTRSGRLPVCVPMAPVSLNPLESTSILPPPLPLASIAAFSVIQGHSCGGPGQAVCEILTLSQVSQGPSHSPIPPSLSQGSFADTTHVGEGLGVPSPPPFLHHTPKQPGEEGEQGPGCLPTLLSGALLRACSPGLNCLAIFSPDCLWPWCRWNSAGGLVPQGSWRIRGAEAGSPRANRLSRLAGWAGRAPSPSSQPCKATTFFLSPPSPFLPSQTSRGWAAEECEHQVDNCCCSRRGRNTLFMPCSSNHLVSDKPPALEQAWAQHPASAPQKVERDHSVKTRAGWHLFLPRSVVWKEHWSSPLQPSKGKA